MNSSDTSAKVFSVRAHFVESPFWQTLPPIFE